MVTNLGTKSQTATLGASDSLRLDSIANNVYAIDDSPSQSGFSLRRWKWKALNYRWENSTVKRFRTCRKYSYGGLVGVTQINGRYGFTNLETCGSTWSCPCCSAKINQHRSEELQTAIRNSHGYRLYLLTLTFQHNRGDSLSTIWDKGNGAWRKFVNSRLWRKSRGNGHYVRVTEVTYGDNGWHPHFHVLIFAPVGSNYDSSLIDLWRDCCLKAGLTTSSLAQDIRPVTPSEAMGKYLAKSAVTRENLALELTYSFSKSRSHWSILASAMAGDSVSRRLWAEWESASRHRRQIVWSKGARDCLGIGVELPDEELAQLEIVDEPSQVFITANGWRSMVQLGLVVDFLSYADGFSLDFALSWLSQFHIEIIDMR